MPDYRKMYDKDYLGAWDIEGKDFTLKIREVKQGDLQSAGGKSKRPVVMFDGAEKGLVLNKTNGKTIAALYGTKTEAWVGKSITIYATKTQMAGEEVDCIRVRPMVPKEAA